MNKLPSVADLAQHVENDLKPFWTCPTTNKDCRTIERPALAIIRQRGDEAWRGSRFQMYASAVLAEAATPYFIECQQGMTADWVLDNWLHYSQKLWVDDAGLSRAVRQIAWHFGSKSWAMVAGTRNPLFVGSENS